MGGKRMKKLNLTKINSFVDTKNGQGNEKKPKKG